MSLEEKIMNFYNSEIKYSKAKKVIRLLKFVLIDKKTELYEIETLVPIGKNTIKKYLEDKDFLLEFLTLEEYNLFKNKIDIIFELNDKKKEKEELVVMTKLIDEILNTRHRIEDICSNNFFAINRFKKLLNETNYIEQNFGIGIKERILEKIEKNSRERLRVPRNMFLIQDRWHIELVNDDILCLDQFDYKKLSYASDYLCSGSNLEFASHKNEVSGMAVLTLLSHPKLQQLLKKNHYDNLKKCLEIEMLLLSNDLQNKEMLLEDISEQIYINNLDKSKLLNHYKLPEYLFDKLLLEIVKLPQFDNEIKEAIKFMLNKDEEKKVK